MKFGGKTGRLFLYLGFLSIYINLFFIVNAYYKSAIFSLTHEWEFVTVILFSVLGLFYNELLPGEAAYIKSEAVKTGLFLCIFAFLTNYFIYAAFRLYMIYSDYMVSDKLGMLISFVLWIAVSAISLKLFRNKSWMLEVTWMYIRFICTLVFSVIVLIVMGDSLGENGYLVFMFATSLALFNFILSSIRINRFLKYSDK